VIDTCAISLLREISSCANIYRITTIKYIASTEIRSVRYLIESFKNKKLNLSGEWFYFCHIVSKYY
jgi:hypothetical protein